MNFTDRAIRQIEEIAENFYISPEIKSTLEEALTLKMETEALFSESQKTGLPYLRVIISIDSHIAGLIVQCTKTARANE